MALTPGTRFGPYEVLAKLGQGGMGEVYRATDTKLSRDVALKVLPDAVAHDPDRLARFHREAKTLAALNHPNIAHLNGLEDHDGTSALVMELVEGQDLSTLIETSRGLTVEDSVPIARQMVDALEAAHELGIVHRDLKPANVKVRADGTVKVLDFGLAKALDPNSSSSIAPDAANSPTFTAHATQLGVIVGTAAYMSPEQARGKPVDKRADIWAFGAVLFEMLSGRAAFAGETVTDILAGVVSREPDWTALPATTSQSLRTLLARCLEKDPKRRLRDIGDARHHLETNRAAEVNTTRASLWSLVIPWTVAAGLVIALAWSLATMDRWPGATDAPVRRYTIQIPSHAGPNWNDFNVAISNDGSRIAYNCRDGNIVGICVRSLDNLTARRVVDTRDATEWFFSPDAESLGFVDEVGLSTVSLRGGEPQRIFRWPGQEQAPTDFVWGHDNVILFGTSAGLQGVRSTGGALESITQTSSESGIKAHRAPSLPDGHNALITIVHADGTGTGGLVSLRDGTVRDLGIKGDNFRYVAPGWLAIRRGNTILAAPFDLGDPARVGNAVPVIENVSRGPVVARDGTLLYIPTRGESNARLVWSDREGHATEIKAERLEYTHLDLAPDDQRAVLNLSGSKIDLIDLRTGTQKLLARGSFPIWSPDNRVTYTSEDGLYSKPIDGSGQEQLLVRHPGFVVATSWNMRTGDLAYYDHRAFEIWIRSPDSKTRSFLTGPGRKRSGRFSPDGKWMAYVSDETEGVNQVYVTAYPGPGPTVTVSNKGGLSPIWSSTGDELFFRTGSKVMMARMTSQAPAFTAPVDLFNGPYTLDLMGHQREDISRDGRRFLMVENSDDFPIVVIQNWARELRQTVR